MDSNDLPLRWRCARTLSTWYPIAWLVFDAQVSLFAWLITNGDMARPVHSPARETSWQVFAFPLFYVPGLDVLLFGWFRGDGIIVQMAANALCWECLLAPILSRRITVLLLAVNEVINVRWPGSGFFGLLGPRGVLP